MKVNWKAFGRNRLLPSLRTIPTFSGDTEGNHEEPQSGSSMLWPRFEPPHHINTNLDRYHYFSHSVVIHASVIMKFAPEIAINHVTK
jgi:hypothetical protein